MLTDLVEEAAPRHQKRKTQFRDEEDEEEQPSTTLPDPSNFVPASEKAQGKIPKKKDHITISSEEEEEESSPARPKLNKGKDKAGQTDSDAESEYDDLEGEVRTADEAA